MRLTELEPKFLRHIVEQVDPTQWVDGVMHPSGQRILLRSVDDITQAQGIKFLCPKCYAQNRGPVGTHAVICWSRSRGTPDSATPAPGRWALVGTGYEDLTLNADPPGTARSVQLVGGCEWHGFITNGEVTSA